MMLGIVVIVLLCLVPIVGMMINQGKINVEKPEKQTYIFEDSNGEKDNPFSSDQSPDQTEWKYS